MPSLIDLLRLGAFNGMFNPDPQASSDPAGLQGLVAALQKKTMPGALPAMPTNGVPNNIAMQPPAQPPQMGTGGPAGAPPPPPMPQMASQPPQMQSASPTPPQGGLQGFLNGPKGDALMGMLAGWAQGGTIGQSLGAGGIGAMQGMKEGKKNRTLQMYLDKSNLDPAMKGLLSDSPELAKAFIAEQFKAPGSGDTAEIKNWNFAQQHPDFAKMLGSQGGSLFGSPIPYTKPDGTIGYASQSRNGDVIDLNPPGGKWMGPGGVAAAKSEGDKRGEASFNLPSVERSIAVVQGNVNKLLTEPGLDRVTGLYGANTPNVTGQARKAQSYIDQVLGGTFLAAYNDLRGGGAITESEGAKAVDAYNRLRATSVDTPDYRQALTDFNDQLNTMLAVARQKAGAGQPAPGGASQPASGGWSVQQVQ